MSIDDFTMADLYEMTPIDLGDGGDPNSPDNSNAGNSDNIDPAGDVVTGNENDTDLDLTNIIDPEGISPIDQDDPANPSGQPTGGQDNQGDNGGQDPNNPLDMGAEGGDDTPPTMDYAAVANQMVSNKFITAIPEDVDVNEFDEAAFWKTVQHNQALREKEAINADRNRLVGALTPMMRELVAYNLNQPNMSEEDMQTFIESQLTADSVTSWQPETHAEQIVREYYKSQNWTVEEVEQKVVDLTAAGGLQKEAVLVKPKLDQQATLTLDRKRKDQAAIAEREKAQMADLQNRTLEILRSGKLKDVDLTREDATLIYNAVLNQDVDVPVRGGRQIKMGAFEAMLYKNRYDTKNGNLQNLMLAALVLEKGEAALEKYFGRKAQNAATEEIFKSAKASAARKAGSTPTQTAQRGKGGLFKLNFNS